MRVKLVEPGYGPTTRFADNLGLSVAGMIPEPYADFAKPIFETFANPPMITREGDVAEAVWLAANDPSDRLRYPAGPDAVALAGPVRSAVFAGWPVGAGATPGATGSGGWRPRVAW